MMLAITACVAAAATLVAPAPIVAGPSGNGHYDCSQDRRFMHYSRYHNAHGMQVLNYFKNIGTDIVDECTAKLNENAGASPGTLHSIAARCETELGYHAYHAEYYLHSIRYGPIQSAFPNCPRLFARDISFNTKLIKRVNNCQADLRDQIKAALAAALVDAP
jgi:hypothetical protein